MRANMKDKPASYPREYFEVHCTTAQKNQIKKEAAKAGLSLSAYVLSKIKIKN